MPLRSTSATVYKSCNEIGHNLYLCFNSNGLTRPFFCGIRYVKMVTSIFTIYFFYWNSHFKTWMLKQLQTMIWVQLQLQTTISSTLVTTSGENHLSITQNIPEKSKLKDRFHQQVGTPSTDHLCNINPWKVLTFTIMYFVAIEVDSIFQRIFFQYCLIK